MSNDFFTFASQLTKRTLARASALNGVFAAIEAGFAKLPTEAAMKEDRVTYATTGGGSNVYTVTSTFPISAYHDGFHARLKFHEANDGPATINFDGIGAIAVKRPNGDDLAAGDLPEDGVVDLTYNGTEFRMNATISVAVAGTAQLANNSVTEPKIADGAVSNSKLASLILKAIVALSPAANQIAYFTGAATVALADFTAYGRSLVAAASSSEARTALELGTAALSADTKYAFRANNLSDLADEASARSNLDVYSKSEVDALIAAAAASAGLPIGTEIHYMVDGLAAGYLACDGSNVSRTTYAALFAAIGTTWGSGNGSTTFTLPDSRRKVAVGKGGTGSGTLGNAVGNTGGAETHTLTTAQMPSHSHTLNNPMSFFTAGNGGGSGPTGVGSNDSAQVTQSIANAGSDAAHNNLQPSYVVTKMIKY